jgi:hypothetical protein
VFILTEAASTDMSVQLRQHLRSRLTILAFGEALRTAFSISDMVMSGNLIGGDIGLLSALAGSAASKFKSTFV